MPGPLQVSLVLRLNVRNALLCLLHFLVSPLLGFRNSQFLHFRFTFIIFSSFLLFLFQYILSFTNRYSIEHQVHQLSRMSFIHVSLKFSNLGVDLFLLLLVALGHRVLKLHDLVLELLPLRPVPGLHGLLLLALHLCKYRYHRVSSPREARPGHRLSYRSMTHPWLASTSWYWPSSERQGSDQ